MASDQATRESTVGSATRIVSALLLLLVVSCATDGTASQSDHGRLLDGRLTPESPLVRLDIVQMQANAEQDTVVCMKAQGFDYTPVDYSYEVQRQEIQTKGPQYGDDFVSQFGYGVVDPNSLSDPAVAALPPSRSGALQESYEVALYGAPVADLLASEDRSFGGCFEETRSSLSQYNNFREQMADILAEVDLDPEVEELRYDWSRCMALLGFDYWDPTAAVDDVRDQLHIVRIGSSPSNSLVEDSFDEVHQFELRLAHADLIECDGDEYRQLRASMASSSSRWSTEKLQVVAELEELRDD